MADEIFDDAGMAVLGALVVTGAVILVDQLQKAQDAAPAGSVKTSISGGVVLPGTNIGPGSGSQYLTAEGAYKLLQSGEVSYVRGKFMSSSISWGSWLKGVSDADARKIPLSSLINGYELVNVGLPKAAAILGVAHLYSTGANASAFRVSSPHSATHSSHKLGLAMDIKTPPGYTPYSAFLKLHNAGWPGDLGWNPFQNFIHISYRTNPYNSGIKQRWTYTASGSPKYTGVFT